jgi:pimeloyl-ACP methyl ester carboxylesterase
MTELALWTDSFFHAQDGLRLHFRDYRPENYYQSGLCPLVCLPGLTRTVRDFHDLAIYFSKQAKTARRVISLDYRGRGMSDHDDWENYTVINEAHDVLALLTSLNIAQAWFIGTSRGGLITMALAAIRPAILKGVVMNDIGPVIDHQGLLGLKQMLNQRQEPASWEEAIYWARRTLSTQFPAFTDEDWENYVRTTYHDVDEKPVMDFDTTLLRSLDVVDADTPLPSLWPQFRGLRHLPTLVIHGERSPLLKRETLEQMHAHHKNMRSFTVVGQGHAPALRGETLQKIAEFI